MLITKINNNIIIYKIYHKNKTLKQKYNVNNRVNKKELIIFMSTNSHCDIVFNNKKKLQNIWIYADNFFCKDVCRFIQTLPKYKCISAENQLREGLTRGFVE